MAKAQGDIKVSPKYQKYQVTLAPGQSQQIQLHEFYGVALDTISPYYDINYVTIAIDDGMPISLTYLPVYTVGQWITLTNNSSDTVTISLIIILDPHTQLEGLSPLQAMAMYNQQITTQLSFTVAANTNNVGSPVKLGTLYVGNRPNNMAMFSFSNNPNIAYLEFAICDPNLQYSCSVYTPQAPAANYVNINNMQFRGHNPVPAVGLYYDYYNPTSTAITVTVYLMFYP
jgi:hypothetical protein